MAVGRASFRGKSVKVGLKVRNMMVTYRANDGEKAIIAVMKI